MVTRILLIGGGLLIAASAFAAPPPGADTTLPPWFHSLHVPGTKILCCDVSDCQHYPVRADGTHYQVLLDNRWLVVPTEAVSDPGRYWTDLPHPPLGYPTFAGIRGTWTAGGDGRPRVQVVLTDEQHPGKSLLRPRTGSQAD
jgi:hypothetical protein